jgi:hypothetical protein
MAACETHPGLWAYSTCRIRFQNGTFIPEGGSPWGGAFDDPECFSFRKRFRPVLRTSAMSFDEQRLKEALSKIDPKILGPRGVYIFLPPWLRRRQKKGPDKIK